MLDLEPPPVEAVLFKENMTDINETGLSASALAFQDLTPYSYNDIIFTIRSLFYLWTPKETMFRTVDEVPNIFVRAVRYMPFLILVEIIGLYVQGKKLPRVNHSLMSCCTFMILFLPASIIGNIEFTWFSILHDKYKIVDLPWDSVHSWVLCFIAADIGLYLWHRAAHEVNFVWAFHSVHHTPDEINMFAGYRLPTFNRQVAIFFYLPMAFIFPPALFYTHYQLNYIYQLWIHTQIVEGPAWVGNVFITPRLHRVHHARNRYCIDKNYGAVLSIWDHLLGTFAPWREDVPLSYGLVSRLQSFDPVAVQFKYMNEIIKKASNYDNWQDKAFAFLKGPGWEPGKPRLGVYEEIPKVYDDEPYDKQSPSWVYAYISWTLLTSLLMFNTLSYTKNMMGLGMAAVHASYIFWMVANGGYFLEHKPWVPLSEVARCVVYFWLEPLILPALGAGSLLVKIMRYSSIGSMLLWSFKINMFGTDPKKVD